MSREVSAKFKRSESGSVQSKTRGEKRDLRLETVVEALESVAEELAE